MIEIIVFVYLFCLTMSIALVSWNYYRLGRRRKSLAFTTLNLNLRQLDLFWSMTHANFESYSVEALAEDERRSRRSTLMMIVFGFFSVPGLLLLIVLTFLARDRREQRVFASPLARTSGLSHAEVSRWVYEFRLGIGGT